MTMPKLATEIYIVTDPGNPEWDELVRMTENEAALVFAAGYKPEVFAQIAHPEDVREFTDFAAERLD